MWPGEVLEALPFIAFGLQIDVTLVAEELVELLLIGSVRSLHPRIKSEDRHLPFSCGVPRLM